jgi:hypothetical protein
MHAIFFQWKVASGREREFEHAWLELTTLIRDERGGLGSRLHRCADGHYFAYAQWPSEHFWGTQPELTARMVELRTQMREFAQLVDDPIRGDVVIDLLIPVNAEAAENVGVTENLGVGKLRCQVPQVDITELSYFLAVVKPIYSLQSFLAENENGPTNS